MSLSGSGLNWTLRHAYRGCDFFRRKLDEAGVDPHSIAIVDDLPRVPFTTKQELREAYPFGWTCVPIGEVVRVHASSGTTGRRTLATYTKRDLGDWAEMVARCFGFAGVTAGDRFQIAVGYGLWTGGIGFQAGVERLGAMTIPTGPGNVDLQFETAQDLEATVLCATASFGLLLAEEAERRGLRDRLYWRIAILGSERWGAATRARIEDLLQVDTFDTYGFTELFGPGTGIDCRHHEGIHYWSDHYLIEVVDPVTGEVLPAGREGELVVTTLRKQAQPLVRYRTHDLSFIHPEPCPCGSPYPRIGRLAGRTDDMFKVRGVQVYPAQVDTVISELGAELGLTGEYQVVLRREGGRDRFLLRVEGDRPEVAARTAAAVRTRTGVRPDVEVVALGSLPRSERKTQRVIDEREGG
ncbi:MAG: phenylacetate--CoA ligase [Candidatus Dormibacteraeota bacterium]|nr:phenylacetate--CoA ligase [Candidatus Dormibacteraeota bacterium]